MIKVIVFDFDGTIIDSNQLKYDAFFRIFEYDKRYKKIVKDVLDRSREETRFSIIERILRIFQQDFPGILLEGDIGEVSLLYAAKYNDIVESAASICPEISGASDALDFLFRRYPLYINSATPLEPLRRIISERSLDGYFVDIYGAPRAKIENLSEILSKESVAGSEILVVGDGAGDLKSALYFSAAFVGVRNDFNRSLEWKKDMVDDLRTLPDLVTSMS